MSTECSVCFLIVCGRFVDVLLAEGTRKARPLFLPKSNVAFYFGVKYFIHVVDISGYWGE